MHLFHASHRRFEEDAISRLLSVYPVLQTCPYLRIQMLLLARHVPDESPGLYSLQRHLGLSQVYLIVRSPQSRIQFGVPPLPSAFAQSQKDC